MSLDVPASEEAFIAEPNQETKYSSDNFADKVIRRVKLLVESRLLVSRKLPFSPSPHAPGFSFRIYRLQIYTISFLQTLGALIFWPDTALWGREPSVHLLCDPGQVTYPL